MGRHLLRRMVQIQLSAATAQRNRLRPISGVIRFDKIMHSTTPVLPARQTAIVAHSKGKLIISDNVPISSLEPDMIIIKNVAVALNPCDHKMVDNYPTPNAIDGCDFAGYVAAIGSAVTQDYQIGDRVCGAVQGSSPNCLTSGSFAQYVGATADILLKMPDDMSFEDAAAIGGTGVTTVGMALFDSMGLPGTPLEPSTKPSFVLVYGGSTATGTMALQCLKLAGFRPITTCSPRNFDLMASYGAEKSFDYNSPTCAEEIKAYTKNSLKYVLDCLTETQTMQLCYNAIGRAGGRYIALELYPDSLLTRKTVKAEMVLGITVFGKQIDLEGGYGRPANPHDREFGTQWFKDFQRLLDDGKIRPHPVKVMDGGFEGILRGLDLMRQRKVSGQKLVYRVA